MKTIFLILTLVFLFATKGYSITNNDTIRFVKAKPDHSKEQNNPSDKTTPVDSDSTEYELIVMDPGYEAFLVTQPSKNFYSEGYYKSWNTRYVMEWNYRYTSRASSGLYESYIDYDPKIEYGIELEYKLYNYFRFFEKANRVTLIPRGR